MMATAIAAEARRRVAQYSGKWTRRREIVKRLGDGRHGQRMDEVESIAGRTKLQEQSVVPDVARRLQNQRSARDERTSRGMRRLRIDWSSRSRRRRSL
jgi:hypothetical protein